MILSEMERNPSITYDELEKIIGKSKSTIVRNVDKLREKGLVERVGSDKKGYWKITR